MRNKKKIVLENVLIENYAAEGKSLARQEGKVIFVENVVPGDLVDIRLSKNKKDWAEGYPLQFKSYSRERVEPFCQHFGVCGGCQWQMLPYEKQLQYKQQQVVDNLTRIGKVKLPEITPIVGAVENRFYRNKLEYTFSTKEFLVEGEFDKTNREKSLHNVLGFHAKGFFDKVVDIHKCWLLTEPNNEIRNAIRGYAHNQNLSFYDYREHAGLLRNLQFRFCTTGEMMVNIVFGADDPKPTKKLLEFVQGRFPQITTLLYTVNTKRNDSIHDLEPIIYSGAGYVIEKLEDFSFKIGPKSFFQTNTRQAETLYSITRTFAELAGSQTLYDLYCGTGSIGVFCSRGAKRIVGVEVNGAAIEDAKQNAAMNRISDSYFYSGDVIDVCDEDFFQRHGHPDVIITDPPRAGMHEKLTRKILEIDSPLIVYVSCNPATQARDLHLLDEKYEVTRVQPVDMFPHTHHIENIVQLKKR